jgi:hypothetical protein
MMRDSPDDDDDCDFEYDSSNILDTEMLNLDSTFPDAYNEHEGLPLLDRDGEACTRPSVEILKKATSSASDTTTPQLGSADSTLSVEAPVSILLLYATEIRSFLPSFLASIFLTCNASSFSFLVNTRHGSNRR